MNKNKSEPVISRGDRPALLRGVYEVTLTARRKPAQPFWPGLARVTFTLPDRIRVTVDGFYDGGRTYRARAYCGQAGHWTWRCRSRDKSLNGVCGSFDVAAADLPGKLRLHPHDRRQFAFDNGEWFLHIGDTGYRYLAATEKQWRPYLDQAVKMGATKIRTWFCQGRYDVQILFAANRTALNLTYWQEMDCRLAHALNTYPRLQFQVIPYGEDTAELKRYAASNRMAKLVAQYAQARFSAYPNVQWCVSNDRVIITRGRENGREILAATIRQIARDMRRREPWGTLLTNHQARFTGYDFVNNAWSDIITLEDLDQVTGALIKKYRRQSGCPVVLEEDRYETYRPPRHPRYFFRRLMWASLLSGGHATYGGYRTYEARGMQAHDLSGPKLKRLQGIQGYYTGKEKLTGAHDFNRIHRFFKKAGITPADMTPADGLTGNDPAHCKCMRGKKSWVLYLANPDHPQPEIAGCAKTPAAVTVSLPAPAAARWFNPVSGTWSQRQLLRQGLHTLRALSGGDQVWLLEFCG